MLGTSQVAVCKLVFATALLTLAPFAVAQASTLDQTQADTSSSANVAGPGAGAGVTRSSAQIFTAGISGTLEGVALNLSKDAATDPLVVELRGVGSDGAPGATVLAQTYLGAEQVPGTGAWLPVGLSAAVTAIARYAIVAYALGGSVYRWHGATTDAYGGGQGYDQPASPPGAAWTASAGDRAFMTYLAAAGAVVQFSDPGCSTWTAPPGVPSVRALATGAAGADVSVPSSGITPAQHAPGGVGDSMTATVADLAPAQKLRVCVNVGGAGRSGSGGPGGGASGVSLGPDFSSPVVVGAGGGAASSAPYTAAGGNAGWPAGADGQGDGAGRGGTQSVAGASAATGQQPASATTPAGPGGGGRGTGDAGGGGGGGWFGGGGGSDFHFPLFPDFNNPGGGGGGSDYCAAFALLCSRTPGGSGPVGVTLTYTVAAPTIARPTGAPFGAGAQGAPLAVSSFTQSARRWRASRSARRPDPVGTTFRFKLNRPAKATLTFYRAADKRRLGALTRTAPAGTSRIRFTGRVSARLRLRPGRYRVVLRATDGTANVAAKRLTFTIVR